MSKINKLSLPEGYTVIAVEDAKIDCNYCHDIDRTDYYGYDGISYSHTLELRLETLKDVIFLRGEDKPSFITGNKNVYIIIEDAE